MENDNNNLQTDLRDPASLRPHPDNPRGEIDQEAPEIVELSASIARHGLIQPIVIQPDNCILAGHRRQLAAIRAGLELVPVIIRPLLTGEFAEEFFLAENKHRQDLSPLEEARAIAALHTKLEAGNRTVPLKDLARRLDIPTNTITLRLHILKFPERVQKLFHNYAVPINAAKQLARLADRPEEIERFADQMVTRHVSLASLDALITRRLAVLEAEDNGQPAKPKRENIRTYLDNDNAMPPLTRAAAVESLGRNLSKNISLIAIKNVLDAVCCSCGMQEMETVCQSCPLPRFVNGIVGRASSN